MQREGGFVALIEQPKVECPKCGWYSAWELVKCKNQGGIYQYFFMCDCGYRQKQYFSYKKIKAAGLDPREVPSPYPKTKCEVCGADGAQRHHWAPYALFGGESEKWPQSYLCQPCHTRWHQIVTPNINRIEDDA